MRSDAIKKGTTRAPHRSLLRAMGLGDDDLCRPFIAVASSHVEIIPGHIHLDRVARLVGDAVKPAACSRIQTTNRPRGL